MKLPLLRLRNKAAGVLPFLMPWGEVLQMLRCVRRWRESGWGGPPPYVIKRAMLRAEGRRMGAKVLVETGTYLGDTMWALRKDFEKLYSIEVQPELAAIARARFRKIPAVTIVPGDSASQLHELVQTIKEPVLFWLDGHYSAGITGRGAKDCPVFDELEAVASIKGVAVSIMIDDARCFGTDPAYPALEDVERAAKRLFPDHRFQVWNDVIHITKSL